MMQEAWSIYGARFRTPKAAAAVQGLLADSFDAPFNRGASELTIIQEANQPLAVQLDSIQLASSKASVGALSLAQQMSAEIGVSDSVSSQECLRQMASLHIAVLALCRTTTFVQDNGLYIGQDSWLKDWVR